MINPEIDRIIKNYGFSDVQIEVDPVLHRFTIRTPGDRPEKLLEEIKEFVSGYYTIMWSPIQRGPTWD